MAFNPFLSMNEPAPPMSDEGLNPFMVTETENSDFLTSENPFATSNPFSDFGNNYEPPAGDTVPVDIFSNTEPINMGAKQFDEQKSTNIFDSHVDQVPDNDKATKPTELDLISTNVDDNFSLRNVAQIQEPVRPVPQETQNLILSVTGQMEFTSSHLLDRIPPTRTPSPVSARDIHSPSPTPEPDVLDDGLTPNENADLTKNLTKPARPPPARPPRPAPPPRPQVPPPHQTQPQVVPQPQADDINLFDAPAPVQVKPTKEAILSLYSAPKKEEKPIDFLSDDIMDIPSDLDISSSIIPSKTINETPSDFIFSDTASNKESINDAIPNDSAVNNNESETNIEMDTSEIADAALHADNVVEMSTSPFENTNIDGDQPMSELDKNPFGNNEMSTTPEPVTHDIFGVQAGGQAAPAESIQPESIAPHTTVSDEAMDVVSGFEETKIETTHFADSSAEFTWNDRNEPTAEDAFPQSEDAFDAFSAKFDSAGGNNRSTDVWGEVGGAEAGAEGFEAEAFDPFLQMQAPPATPRLQPQHSADSADDTFSVFIRPKGEGEEGSVVPALAPPPRAPAPPDRANPFDASAAPPHELPAALAQGAEARGGEARGGSGAETPPTPLFDEDVSAPLEDFPRTRYTGPGWEMHLRHPNKKKITGQRFWKKVFVRMVTGDSPAVQLLNSAADKEPLQELPLQACYSVSDIGAQQFDQFGKIFTVKLQYVFYKERPGVRPGQVTKAERITNKLSQFAAYAIQGDYQGVKEFGSDLRKLGLPVEHAPQVSQLFKLGSLNYEHVKEFSCCIEEALFKLSAHRDRALTYKMEEVQVTAVDELYVEQDAEGSVLKQIARVRLFFLGFLSGMPDVELGVNDLRRQGKEVVGRHDIIPVVTEEWIRVEEPEFHACVQPQAFHETQIIRFKPPDACYIELLRFRVRPPKNRELPLQLKAVWCVAGNRVELRADVLVPGFASRKLGQVPCEDVAIRFPIPECWIYLFRVEKHFRYGSVKSAHRRTGKIKGIERFLGAVETLQESLIEVTSGQAKYEHQHRAIVWRMPRLPKEGQGAYTTHNLVCRMALTSYDQVPEELARWAHVEFTMPATQVSHTTVRSVSLAGHDGDPPEKYVRYLARHEYRVGIERSSAAPPPAYALAAAHPAPPAAAPAPTAAPTAAPAPPSSDSDSD